MNWYKKLIAEILNPTETIKNVPIQKWWEAIKLKDGRIIYDDVCNHWALFYNYHHIIKSLDNIKSIGLLEGDGTYTPKYNGQDLEKWKKNELGKY